MTTDIGDRFFSIRLVRPNDRYTKLKQGNVLLFLPSISSLENNRP